ncbi:related to allantoate permease [Phialocephala subalpina]|uniref:Related to allantoate permease n=1 Tax=Phialocephala subalpina TaxID=576137 RepID=A0A1L7WEY7_9HELO|nr:related to allantoate permease [Phialocephala subalpina]
MSDIENKDQASSKDPINISSDKDGSLGEFLDAEVGASPFTAEEERRVKLKTDLVILPLLCGVFFLQYLDKQSLSYASVFGLITDLKLKGTEYSWCSSIFYIGQLVSEYPFIYLMSRLPLAKFVGLTIVIWGIVCMCLAAPTNYAGFATVRFLLGFCEGAVSPATWISMNGLSQIVGGLLMYGIGKNSNLSLAPWRTLFLICGALTSAMGVLFFAMPSGPDKAWFFTPREREVAAMRLARDHEGGDKTNFSILQLLEALKDVKTWLTFAFGVLVTVPSPVSLPWSSATSDTTSSKPCSTARPQEQSKYSSSGLECSAATFSQKNRSLIVMILVIVPLIGNILLLKLSLSSGWGMIVASWLASVISDIFSITLCLSASNVKGNTKRAVVNTIYFIGYCAGCIGAPQLWLSTQKPRYKQGLITDLVAWGLLLICTSYYWYVCDSENKRRDKLEAEGRIDVLFEKGADVTDGEDLSFRYNC